MNPEILDLSIRHKRRRNGEEGESGEKGIRHPKAKSGDQPETPNLPEPRVSMVSRVCQTLNPKPQTLNLRRFRVQGRALKFPELTIAPRWKTS